jgi:uncharacterized protein (DUF58 family)
VEFDRHRSYEPGDELRHIDWKVFARSDRLVLKHARMETTLDVQFLLDDSGSMLFGSQGAWGTKFELATAVIHALAWLAVDAGDRVAGWQCVNMQSTSPQPRGGVVGLSQITDSCGGEASQGDAVDLQSISSMLVSAVQRPSLVVVVSDLFETHTSLERFLGQIRHAGHDVLLLQVLDQAERFFEVPPEARLVDLEGSTSVRVQARSLREEYLSALERHQSFITDTCQRLQIDHLVLDPHQSPVPDLRSLLHRRAEGLSTGRTLG